MHTIIGTLRRAALTVAAPMFALCAASAAQAAVDITYSVAAFSDIENVTNFESYEGGAGRGGLGGGRILPANDPTIAQFTVFDIPTPANVFFAGTSFYLDEEGPVESLLTQQRRAIVEVPFETHLILAVNTAYALENAGQQFSDLFGLDEAAVISALQCGSSDSCTESDFSLLGDFQNAVVGNGAAIAVDGPTTLPTSFSLLSFSSAKPFGIGTLTATLTGAVPEPASWAMMIGGIGFVGGALRRRRTATAALA